MLQAFGFSNARVARDGGELTGFDEWRVLQDLEFTEMVLAIAGDRPVIARKPNYLEDPAFAGQFDENGFYGDAPQRRREIKPPQKPSRRGSLAELKRIRARERAEAAQGRPPTASEVLDGKFDLSGPEFSPPENIPDPFLTPDDDETGNRVDKDKTRKPSTPNADPGDGETP